MVLQYLSSIFSKEIQIKYHFKGILQNLVFKSISLNSIFKILWQGVVSLKMLISKQMSVFIPCIGKKIFPPCNCLCLPLIRICHSSKIHFQLLYTSTWTAHNNTNYRHATHELRMESTNLIPPTLSSDSSFLNFLGVRGFFLALFSDSSSGISKAALSRPRPPLMDCHTQRQHSQHAAPQH